VAAESKCFEQEIHSTKTLASKLGSVHMLPGTNCLPVGQGNFLAASPACYHSSRPSALPTIRCSFCCFTSHPCPGDAPHPPEPDSNAPSPTKPGAWSSAPGPSVTCSCCPEHPRGSAVGDTSGAVSVISDFWTTTLSKRIILMCNR
jgi:hypothetical protein